ncbi:EF-hand domain-containing family member C2-like isoform X2 [Photinus pyralis]|uniref:EF-hand domain-containing family member C2-like isoform X2 n=1 Tax=Photinus pyralis TaxID=7054 RepID=UPI00126722E1|nr:EF-hand domain-containing family member C2-like isoform X2 [Photinus pyralis]XP_031356130.1 EF-hand domain-containing family member C2-like isoform X2 [Photinus pyralis]
MARCPGLPFLPGFTFNPLIGKTKFNIDPKFDFIEKGVGALCERVKPNMLGNLTDRYPSLYPRGEVPEIPSWIGFDKQILRFYAFFRETLQEHRCAPFQIRKVVIYFFLEDGTIQVMEPKIDNSGISQGTLLARARVRFPAPMNANFYDVMDLNVGNEVEFYGRVYKITDCDKFTRNFLNRCGIAVPDPINVPEDPYYKSRAYDIETRLPKKPSRKIDTLGKFLENDRKVLRFYGYWDDQETQYGYLHHLEVLYYLSDDTIDIKEVVVDNGGHKSSSVFFRRDKLVKKYTGLPRPGDHCHLTLLNVLGNDIKSSRYVVDSLDCGKEHRDYYLEQDLTIGGMINVYGRKVVLTDCDSYTKEYYRAKYGLDSFVPIPKPLDSQMGIPTPQERELPPWNGYGSFEDSAQNCITVEPKAPHGDFKKFLKFDKNGLDSHVLRFEGRLISSIDENCGRIFVISYFLSNDTIAVFELARANSGFKTSPFFKRGEIKLPGQAVFTSKPPECYRTQHIFVGATLVINSFKFVLVDADDYALRYMELNCHEFPKSNIKLIMDKIRKVVRPTYKDFVAENIPTETPVITYEKLRNKLCRLMGSDFTEQEMITVSRAFSANCVEEKFNRDAIRIVKDQHGNLIYDDLLKFLNRDLCAMADTIPINIKYELYWTSDRDVKAGTLINWCEFNKSLDLEKEIVDASGPFVEEGQ